MSFVTAEDFNVVPYKIPNLDDATIAAEFQTFVDNMEGDILHDLLGSSLKKMFIDGLAELPDEWVGTNDPGYAIDAEVVYGVSIWKSLQNDNLNHIPEEGLYWTKVEDNRWLLLKLGDTYKYKLKEYKWVGMKQMLIPYIYSEWTRETFNYNVGTGVVVPTNENATTINPSRKIASAWNAFSRIAGNCYMQTDSLYGYLINKNGESGTFDDTFDETFQTFNAYLNTVFKAPGRQNIFNL